MSLFQTRIIREWAGWQLTREGECYFLNRHDDPAWFRPIVTDEGEEAAIVETERIIAEDNLSKPIDWLKQPHSKKKCFEMALQLREELLKYGEAPAPLRELVSVLCRIVWKV